MKPFLRQFRECDAAGLHKGRIRKKITPDMLPLCPTKAKKMAKIILRDKITHFSLIKCGKFGGVCRGHHPKCLQLRVEDYCHSASDGECFWEHCPQIRDNEPAKSGRSCPLHWLEDDEV